jgi:hypothetical protein
MPMHARVMRKELRESQNNWKTNAARAPHLDIIDNLPEIDVQQKLEKEAMDNFADAFFKIVIDKFEKNFDQWRVKNLQLMLGGDHVGAWALALCVEGKATPDTSHTSEKHNANVDVKDTLECLTEKVTSDQLKQRRHCQLHKLAVKEMAADEGGNAFDPTASPAVTGFRKFVEGRWFPLPSNAQFVEAGMKDAKVRATTNQDEMPRSAPAMIRSALVSPCVKQAIAKRGATLKGSQ